jgi:D-arabinono-1,4-lactone oxidase
MALITAPIRDADGFIHPADEAEVVELVRFAAAHGRHVRVRGAGHSPPDSFAPDGPEDLVLSLDRMRGLEVLDLEERIIRAQGGIHLGQDPLAPGEDGAAENSLLHQLAHRYGWTLSSTGGITHQTLGGFLATTSAGGSVQHSVLDHVIAVRLVDGRGEIREFRDGGGDGSGGGDGEGAEDGDGPGLAGVLPSLGLLGVIVAVTLRCEPIFTIVGQEAIVDLEGAAIDFAGPGDSHRPSLAEFFARAEYARIEWWPQRGAERLLIWQAQRARLQPGFLPTRYEEFTQYPVLAEALFSSIYVIFGNLMAPERIGRLLARNAAEVSGYLDVLRAEGRITGRRRVVAWAVPRAMRALGRAAPLLRFLRTPLRAGLPWLVPAALKTVLPLDDRKPGIRSGEPQSFHDWSWEGLPMDNQADDVLLWTQFTELWVPLARASELVQVLRAYFAEPADARDSYRRTGLYAYELYAAPPATGWIHPGYSTGSDEWSEGAVRLDVYWFDDNAEDPRERFYRQFWELLSEHGIGYRAHWGKELPTDRPDHAGPPDLPGRLAAQYPRWNDWLALREACDPDGVFLTEYWRVRLGLPARPR